MKLANLVEQKSTTTGTGDMTLTTINGRQPFSVHGTGATTDVFPYHIWSEAAAEWETGTGHMSDATTLVRDTVLKSSNSNALVSFSAGTKRITNVLPAEDVGKRLFSVASRTEMKAVDSAMYGVVYFDGSPWDWDSGVLIATHQADTGEGIYVPPAAGSNGAWKRRFTGYVRTSWCGGLANALDISNTVHVDADETISSLVTIPNGAHITSDPGATLTMSGDINMLATSAGSERTVLDGLVLDGNLQNTYTNNYAIVTVIGEAWLHRCKIKNVGRQGVSAGSGSISGVPVRVYLSYCDFLVGAGHGGSASQTCNFVYGQWGDFTAETNGIYVDHCYFYDTAKTDTKDATTAIITSQANTSESGRVVVTNSTFVGVGCHNTNNPTGPINLYGHNDGSIITGNRFIDYVGIAIKFEGSGHATISHNIIEGPIDANQDGAIKVAGKSASNSGDAVTVSGNVVKSSATYGIFVSGNSTEDYYGISVSGNTLDACATDGILVQYCKDSSFTGNAINGCTLNGMKFSTCGGVITVMGNVISNSGADGIDTSGEDNVANFVLTGNAVREFGGTYGMQLDNLNAVTVSGNSISHASGSGKTGLRVSGATARVRSANNDVSITGGTNRSISAPSAGRAYLWDDSSASNVALQNKASYVFYKNGAAFPDVTGTTAETSIVAMTIPGGTLGANGVVRIRVLSTHTNNTNAKTLRVYFGGVLVLGPTMTTTATFRDEHEIFNRNSVSSQVFYGSGSQAGGFGSTSGALLTGTVNTASDVTVEVTGQLGNAADSIILQSLIVEVAPAD